MNYFKLLGETKNHLQQLQFEIAFWKWLHSKYKRNGYVFELARFKLFLIWVEETEFFYFFHMGSFCVPALLELKTDIQAFGSKLKGELVVKEALVIPQKLSAKTRHLIN